MSSLYNHILKSTSSRLLEPSNTQETEPCFRGIVDLTIACRPTQQAHFWPDQPGLLAGRDVQAGGTWMGLHPATARVALLTNLRSAAPQVRGEV
jgi:hypothetical protein